MIDEAPERNISNPATFMVLRRGRIRNWFYICRVIARFREMYYKTGWKQK